MTQLQKTLTISAKVILSSLIDACDALNNRQLEKVPLYCAAIAPLNTQLAEAVKQGSISKQELLTQTKIAPETLQGLLALKATCEDMAQAHPTLTALNNTLKPLCDNIATFTSCFPEKG